MSLPAILTPSTELLARDESAWAVGVSRLFTHLPAFIAASTDETQLKECIGVTRGIVKAAEATNRLDVLVEATAFISDAERRIVELAGPPDKGRPKDNVNTGLTLPGSERETLRQMRRAHPQAWATGEVKADADADYQRTRAEHIEQAKPLTRKALAEKHNPPTRLVYEPSEIALNWTGVVGDLQSLAKRFEKHSGKALAQWAEEDNRVQDIERLLVALRKVDSHLTALRRMAQ